MIVSSRVYRLLDFIVPPIIFWGNIATDRQKKTRKPQDAIALILSVRKSNGERYNGGKHG